MNFVLLQLGDHILNGMSRLIQTMFNHIHLQN